ncbi:dethiobiotin synthase [Mucisphaera calidilacus]|nr:dethiobiotin synthase [Mucisphaera calidilacus]
MCTDWQTAMKPSTRPGLFVTGTDTGVGKTALTAALCRLLRSAGERVLPFKPMASGAVERDGRWLAEDAMALAASVGDDIDPASVCPVTFREWLAPGIAAAQRGERVNWPAIGRAWLEAQAQATSLLVEGAGGLEVPLDASGHPTVLELMMHLGLPALIVARSGLGTLNHTTLTVRALRSSGVRVAGVVMSDGPEGVTDDASVASNRAWLERMADVTVLARLPRSTHDPVWADPAWASILSKVDWAGLITDESISDPRR